MFLHIGLLLLCLGRLSLGEPPVPYPPAGPPSGQAFSHRPGGSGQYQDLPEVIDSRAGDNDQANHRIHFNLFKDHETKKSKDNISFKLGQGEGQFRNGGGQNFGRNFQGAPDNKYGPPERSELSQKYGAPQGKSLSRNYGAPEFNQQSYDIGRQGNDISRYSAPTQNDVSSRYGPPQQSFDQRRQQNPSQDYQTDFSTSSSLGRQQGSTAQGYQFQSQSRSASSPAYSPNTFAKSNKPTESYGPPQSFGSSGKTSFQQPASSYGAPRQFQPNSQPSPTYGVPQQGQYQLRNMDQYQQRSHNLNSLNGYNNLQNQRDGFQNRQFNGDGRSSEEMTERANYEYEYEVRGEQSHGHEESREGDEAWGSYRVQLPDGRTMLVEYTADDRGYRPKITYTDQQTEQQPY